MSGPDEALFETEICDWLVDHGGYVAVKELDKRGAVDVLRHGLVDLVITIRVAYFRPAHWLTPELVEKYRANRLTAPQEPHQAPALQPRQRRQPAELGWPRHVGTRQIDDARERYISSRWGAGEAARSAEG